MLSVDDRLPRTNPPITLTLMEVQLQANRTLQLPYSGPGTFTPGTVSRRPPLAKTPLPNRYGPWVQVPCQTIIAMPCPDSDMNHNALATLSNRRK